MAKRKTKAATIAKAKKFAPVIPPITCPYIDHIITMIGDIPETENWSNADEMRKDLIIASLEYIRSCNDQLRQSGSYWYDKFTKAV
jgi:hypothetical protein